MVYCTVAKSRQLSSRKFFGQGLNDAETRFEYSTVCPGREPAHVVAMFGINDNALAPETAAPQDLHYRIAVEPVHHGGSKSYFPRMPHAGLHPMLTRGASQPAVDRAKQVVRSPQCRETFALQICKDPLCFCHKSIPYWIQYPGKA